MKDPFRDELENAHARNAQLEAENARLKGELEATRPPTAHKQLAIPWSFVAFLSVLALSLVAMVSIALAPRAQPSLAGDRQFPGVAIAQPPPVPGPRHLAVPSPPSTSWSCTCAAGDPLCDCPPAEPPWRAIPPLDAKATPFELAASDNPADWQKARERVESKVYSRRGTPAEIRLLKAICKKQGDRTCVEVCQGLDVAGPTPNPQHL